MEISNTNIEKVKLVVEDGDGAGGNAAGAAVSGSDGMYSGGVAYSNASNTAGMGSIVAAQPSTNPGCTTGNDFTSGGGTIGSGDISKPMNKKPFEKSPMGKNHGSNTGKKSRIKKSDIDALKNHFSKKQDFTSGQGKRENGKIMNYQNFMKNKMTTVTKLSA